MTPRLVLRDLYSDYVKWYRQNELTRFNSLSIDYITLGRIAQFLHEVPDIRNHIFELRISWQSQHENFWTRLSKVLPAADMNLKSLQFHDVDLNFIVERGMLDSLPYSRKVERVVFSGVCASPEYLDALLQRFPHSTEVYIGALAKGSSDPSRRLAPDRSVNRRISHLRLTGDFRWEFIPPWQYIRRLDLECVAYAELQAASALVRSLAPRLEHLSLGCQWNTLGTRSSDIGLLMIKDLPALRILHLNLGKPTMADALWATYVLRTRTSVHQTTDFTIPAGLSEVVISIKLNRSKYDMRWVDPNWNLTAPIFSTPNIRVKFVQTGTVELSAARAAIQDAFAFLDLRSPGQRGVIEVVDITC
ncbi:hypothetical protein OBBRIDRAFT_838164 [Obba rivulosa]|uniref:Uncharacterized protein n=1 Tax=Obba rivulosa TaxID=1052685 RepID=A0A8E2AQC6_9APHY|nr:hypothetical protein OBBRIDRAFT_838164 [Obba rivulosa]